MNEDKKCKLSSVFNKDFAQSIFNFLVSGGENERAIVCNMITDMLADNIEPPIITHTVIVAMQTAHISGVANIVMCMPNLNIIIETIYPDREYASKIAIQIMTLIMGITKHLSGKVHVSSADTQFPIGGAKK